MSDLKKDVFLIVKEGTIKDSILQFKFRKSGFYYYYKFKDCNRESCDFNNFEKIKIHREIRREYITKYDIITFPRNITPPPPPPPPAIVNVTGFVELTSLVKRQNDESMQKRKQEKYLEEVKKQQNQTLHHKNANIIQKDKIVNDGINNALKIYDFIMIVFKNNSYLLLQCIYIDNSNYYFLKLFIMNRIVQYKNDEMDKIHECSHDCINQLLSDSHIFNIYHDSKLYNDDVYAKIIVPGHTNNISSALNTKTSPVIVVSVKNGSTPHNENMAVVLRNNTKTKSMTNSNNIDNMKYNIVTNSNNQNKSKKQRSIPITHIGVLKIYKNLKKLVKAENRKKTRFFTLNLKGKKNPNNKTKNKKSNESKNNDKSPNKLLEILDSIKKPSSSKNIIDLKQKPLVMKSGDRVIFNIFDDIYYFMECDKVLNKGDNTNEYKMKMYECNKKTKKCGVNENTNITLNEKQMEYIIKNSLVIKIYKLKEDFNDIAHELLLSSEKCNDINELYNNIGKLGTIKE